MTDDDRLKCVPVMMAIERAGGPDKADEELEKQATDLRLTKRSSIGLRYTIRGWGRTPRTGLGGRRRRSRRAPGSGAGCCRRCRGRRCPGWEPAP